MNAKTFKLAVLFADISAPLHRSWQDIVDQRLSILRGLCQSYRGRIISTDAMTIMSCFPDTDDACMAAIDIQSSLFAQTGCAARIGIHSGLCLVRGSNIFGPVVDETRALLTLAAEGDIVVSEALVSDALEPVSSRASRIQDNAGPPRYRLQWRQPAAQSPADKAKPAADKAKPAAPAQAMAAVAERIEERAEATDGFAQGPLGQEAAVEPVVLESMSAVPEFEGSDSAEQAFEALPEEPVLVLRSADNTIDIVPDSGVFCIGRDANLNDWTFAKPVVSRSHLRIEFQEGIYVLQDCSSNGTYVSIDGEGEVHLLQDTMILQGHGLISLAVAARTDPELTIRFELHDTG